MVTTLAILNCNLDIEYEAIIKKTLSRIQSYEQIRSQVSGVPPQADQETEVIGPDT